MTYRDAPDGDDSDNSDGYQFARTPKSKGTTTTNTQQYDKSVAARDRKRQLEDQIRHSMKALNSPVPDKSTAMAQSYHPSYQSGGEGTYGGTTTTYSSPATSFNQYSSSRNHVTNTPLTSSAGQHSASGVMYSLIQCIGTAVRLGTSDIVEQPTALYESLRSVLGGGRASIHSSSSLSSPSSFSPSYDQPRGSYQNVDTPNYYQSGAGPGI